MSLRIYRRKASVILANAFCALLFGCSPSSSPPSEPSADHVIELVEADLPSFPDSEENAWDVVALKKEWADAWAAKPKTLDDLMFSRMYPSPKATNLVPVGSLGRNYDDLVTTTTIGLSPDDKQLMQNFKDGTQYGENYYIPCPSAYFTAARHVEMAGKAAILAGVIDESLKTARVLLYRDDNEDGLAKEDELVFDIEVSSEGLVSAFCVASNGDAFFIDLVGRKIGRIVDSDGDQIPDQLAASPFYSYDPIDSVQLRADYFGAFSPQKVQLIWGARSALTIRTVLEDTTGDGVADSVQKTEDRGKKHPPRLAAPAIPGSTLVYLRGVPGKTLAIADASGAELGTATCEHIYFMSPYGVARLSLSRPLLEGEELKFFEVSDPNLSATKMVRAFADPYPAKISPSLIKASGPREIEVEGLNLDQSIEAIVRTVDGVEMSATLLSQALNLARFQLPEIEAGARFKLYVRKMGELDRSKWKMFHFTSH